MKDPLRAPPPRLPPLPRAQCSVPELPELLAPDPGAGEGRHGNAVDDRLERLARDRPCLPLNAPRLARFADTAADDVASLFASSAGATMPHRERHESLGCAA